MNNILHGVSIIGIRHYPSDFIGTSGVEVYVENIIVALQKINHKIPFFLYTKSPYSSYVDSGWVKRIPIYTVRSKVYESVIYSFLASIKSIFDDSRIVWYQGVGPGFFSWIPRIFGKKVLITIHSFDWQRIKWTPLERVLFYIAVRFMFLTKPNLCAVSEKLRQKVATEFGIQIDCMPPGLPQRVLLKSACLKKYNLELYKYLIYVGRIVPEKKLELLIDAFLEIRKKYPDLKLVITGNHGNYPEYEQKLKQKYSDKSIIWTGYLFGENKYNLINYSLCFVLPSLLEGFSLTLLESIAYGKHCIVNEAANPFGANNFRNIHIFKSADRSELRVTLIKVIKKAYKENHIRYSNAENKYLESFSWEKTASKYESTFLNLTSKRFFFNG